MKGVLLSVRLLLQPYLERLLGSLDGPECLSWMGCEVGGWVGLGGRRVAE